MGNESRLEGGRPETGGMGGVEEVGLHACACVRGLLPPAISLTFEGSSASRPAWR